MDHQVRMRGLHRPAHAHEQGQALAHVRPARLAPGVQRFAVDEFHHQVGQAGCGGAAVVQARDVRVLQACEDASLLGQALGGARIGQPAQQLDRDLARIEVVGALGGVDHAHAAGGQALGQAPGAERVAGLEFGRGDPRQQSVQRCAGALQRNGLGAEQFQGLAQQLGVGGQALELAAPGVGRKIADRIEQFTQLLPTPVIAHAAPP